MSGAVSLGSLATSAILGVGSALLQNAFAPKRKTSAPQPQAPQAPQAPPQAAQQPDEQARRAARATAGPAAARQSTMLTGSTGVAPGALNLGRNTLLGQ